MPAASSGEREGLALAVVVLTLAVLFAWKLRSDRRNRSDQDLSPEDFSYFARRDVRRMAGNAVLGLIGLGMVVGSTLDHRQHRLAFLLSWLLVGGLVSVVLVLALIDWGANRIYANRHRRILIEQRRALLRDELRRHLDRARERRDRPAANDS